MKNKNVGHFVNPWLHIFKDNTNIAYKIVITLLQIIFFSTFVISDFRHKLDGGPWFVGLDELLRYYCHGANGLPCAIKECCVGETLPAELLASGPDTILHIATRNADINAVRNVSYTIKK